MCLSEAKAAEAAAAAAAAAAEAAALEAAAAARRAALEAAEEERQSALRLQGPVYMHIVLGSLVSNMLFNRRMAWSRVLFQAKARFFFPVACMSIHFNINE